MDLSLVKWMRYHYHSSVLLARLYKMLISFIVFMYYWFEHSCFRGIVAIQSVLLRHYSCTGQGEFHLTSLHGPLTRYVKLRVAHAPGIFSRAVMHAGIANQRLPLKAVAGKTSPTFPAHAQPVISRIWWEAHCTCRIPGVSFTNMVWLRLGHG